MSAKKNLKASYVESKFAQKNTPFLIRIGKFVKPGMFLFYIGSIFVISFLCLYLLSFAGFSELLGDFHE